MNKHSTVESWQINERRIVFLTQVYWPDTVATAEFMADLSQIVAQAGYKVEVWTSRYAYESPQQKYPRYEICKQVAIRRVFSTHFSKRTIVGRACNFLSFNLCLFARLLLCGKKWHMFFVCSSPPFLAFFCALVAKIYHKKFFFWNLDLQPDLAIACGLLAKDSWVAKIFSSLAKFSYDQANGLLVLDRFMQERLKNHYNVQKNVRSIALWPLTQSEYRGDFHTNPFRVKHDYGQKIAVHYAGNHSLVHPLDTLLQGAKLLAADPRFLFVFVGKGVRVQEVKNFRQVHKLQSVMQLDFVPRSELHIALAAADIQVVVMGDEMVGLTHPQKIYGLLQCSKPVLYIGPTPSHVSEILQENKDNIIVAPGQSELLAKKLRKFADLSLTQRAAIGKRNREILDDRFPPAKLQQATLQWVEQVFASAD